MDHKREDAEPKTANKSAIKTIAVRFKSAEEKERAEAFFSQNSLVAGKWVRNQIIEKMEQQEN